jgi:hypothetical protein
MAIFCACARRAVQGPFLRSAVLLAFVYGLISPLASSRLAAADASAIMSAMESITSDDAQGVVDVLAADAMEGRETGSRGGRAAGAYLAEQLQKLKLRGGGVNKGYWQPFGSGSRNLLGVLEGRDPELKDQYVIICAHYDHVGYGKSTNSRGPLGQIHNGADDNASGDAGVIETARAFATLPEAPKRSVIFALWDGEEAGLLGAKYWIANPTVPLSSVAAAINVDMIGRLRKDHLIVYGGRTSWGWRQRVSRENDATKLALDFDWLMKADSDHHPFYTAGVPVIMFHTGLHDDYHRPSDDADKINSDGLKLVSQLLFRTAYDLAEQDSRPKFRTQSREESTGTKDSVEQQLPPLAGRLGLAWDPAKAKDGIVQIASLTASGAAAKAGLKVGDKIISYAGRPISDVEDLRSFVLATRGAVPLEYVREGSETPVQTKVEPSGSPSTVGITWKLDDAEPNSVFLVRIIPGSPADRAGLRLFDRVYEVNGKKFATSDEFRELVNSAPGPVQLLVEKGGVIRRVEVQRLEPITAGAEGSHAQQIPRAHSDDFSADTEI